MNLDTSMDCTTYPKYKRQKLAQMSLTFTTFWRRYTISKGNIKDLSPGKGTLLIFQNKFSHRVFVSLKTFFYIDYWNKLLDCKGRCEQVKKEFACQVCRSRSQPLLCKAQFISKASLPNQSELIEETFYRTIMYRLSISTQCYCIL